MSLTSRLSYQKQDCDLIKHFMGKPATSSEHQNDRINNWTDCSVLQMFVQQHGFHDVHALALTSQHSLGRNMLLKRMLMSSLLLQPPSICSHTCCSDCQLDMNRHQSRFRNERQESQVSPDSCLQACLMQLPGRSRPNRALRPC